MKQNTLLAGALSVCLLFACICPLHAQYYRKNSGERKKANVAISITDKEKTPPRTYFSVGLLSNHSCLYGMGINVISSVAQFHAKAFQITGLTNITGLNAAGVQLAGIANVTGMQAKGFFVGGLLNVSGRTTSGFALSGIGNFSGKNSRGVLFGGLMNISSGETDGLLIAGLANIAKQTQNGIMAGGLLNVAGDTLRGLQTAGLLNVVGESNNGVQLAALGNVTVANRGVQFAIGNYAAKNKGVQAGLANVSGEGRKGLQLGLFNLSADSLAHQVGIVNVTPRTRIQLLVSGGNLNKINVAVRFKNRYTYTELGGGAYYFDLDHDVSVSGFYRAGAYYSLLPCLEISADAGFYHIETLDNKYNGYPARAYALQPRMNIEYRITRKFGVFASGGYSWTRQYGHNHTIDRKGTFEAGIVLF